MINTPLLNHAGQRLDFRFHESPAPLDARHIVLIGHGLTANLDRPFLKALAEGLANAGFHALRFSWSGNGQSEGDFQDSCISREVAELKAIVDSVTAQGFSVSYAGHSMGGAVGVLFAAQDQRLRRLISLAGLVETTRFLEAEFGGVTPGAGQMWDEPEFPLSVTFAEDMRRIVSTSTAAQSVTVPFLLIHGTQDDLVPAAEARALFHAGAGNPGTLIELEADHVFTGEATADMVAAVIHWLKS